jgi:transcriptional regulator with XRE-family HTH domain
MELYCEAVAILTPAELRTLRKLAGWTLDRLTQESKVSKTQLSQYENGRNGLRVDQLKTCERLLLRAAADKSQTIRTLFGKRVEDAESMATAS